MSGVSRNYPTKVLRATPGGIALQKFIDSVFQSQETNLVIEIYFKPSNSTSNTRVAPGGIKPPAPLEP